VQAAVVIPLRGFCREVAAARCWLPSSAPELLRWMAESVVQAAGDLPVPRSYQVRQKSGVGASLRLVVLDDPGFARRGCRRSASAGAPCGGAARVVSHMPIFRGPRRSSQ